ncbi:hypothetical protein [Microcoleus anatoxicus]|uniref:Uncharacterized protein n=1 Tax=Microcoleus anatoxicus PTRS2 TaxID=2705321 RepID=A0ABU8YMK5_9CYAN
MDSIKAATPSDHLPWLLYLSRRWPVRPMNCTQSRSNLLSMYPCLLPFWLVYASMRYTMLAKSGVSRGDRT